MIKNRSKLSLAAMLTWSSRKRLTSMTLISQTATTSTSWWIKLTSRAQDTIGWSQLQLVPGTELSIAQQIPLTTAFKTPSNVGEDHQEWTEESPQARRPSSKWKRQKKKKTITVNTSKIKLRIPLKILTKNQPVVNLPKITQRASMPMVVPGSSTWSQILIVLKELLIQAL